MKIESADTEQPSSPRRRRPWPVAPAETLSTRLAAAELPASPDPLDTSSPGDSGDAGVVANTPEA
jgi:hypothetical protein